MNPQTPDQDMPSNGDDMPKNKKTESMDSELQSEIEQFDALLDQHLPAETSAPRGELMEVPVVAIKEDVVLVDVGGKAEATININEFPKIDDKPLVSVGDIIKVVQTGRNSDGTPRLSHREARTREAEQKISTVLENKTPIKGVVVQTVKGGVMVDIGLLAFMPASQIDLFKIPDLESLKGQEIESYVIEFDPRRKRAVLSRRQLLFEQRESERKAAISKLMVDDVVNGKIKNCLDFGVFLDLGVIDGFIPREEVSYDRGTHPKDILKSGDQIDAKVIKIDEETGKVTLSRKRLSPDPWDTIESRYAVGNIVKGFVIAIQNYGVFVHLEEGVTGMIHASDLSWSSSNKNPKDFVNVGQEVETKVLELNKDDRRLSLGLKQTEKDPWADVENEFPRNAKVKGTITSLTTYGAFVKLNDYVEGMIHVSDMSWEKHINHPKEVFEPGQEVEAIVLKCDPSNHRISLGVKQLGHSPFDGFLAENPVNSIVTGKVVRFAPFGAFVELAENLEGLIHISQIDVKRVELPEKALTLGEDVTVKITKVDKKKQKISLSRRDAINDAERADVKQYLKKDKDAHGGITFGEALSKAKKDQQS